MSVKPIPDEFHTVTPHLVVRDAVQAITFYERAFGAREVRRHMYPDGKKVMHAQLRFGNSPLLLTEENLEWGVHSPLSLKGTPITLHLYVEDVDARFEQAVKAGATVKMPLMDAFWGDRYGQVTDPYGHVWSLAMHVEDLTEAQIQERGKAFFSGMKHKQG
jgi:PhnB protein